jgi:hypothetical protein
MARFSKLSLSVATAAVLAAGPAVAVPLGSGTLAVDLQGTVTDNVTCLLGTFDNATYDVFGTDVNLSTGAGLFVCTGGQVGGVLQPSVCESHPDDTILLASIDGTSICLNPPSCVSSSFVSDPFDFGGTLAAAIGSDIVYTTDGTLNYTGTLPSTSIPGCGLSGTVLHFTGLFGVNAFQTVSTSIGSNQTAEFPETTFFNPLTGEDVPIDVTITFSEVTGAGTTTVAATSNSAGTIPANFAYSVYGYQAAFLEIQTTAIVDAPIEICTAYADADHDGFVDDTTPPVPESALSFLHREGGTFVDRTSLRLPVGNVICATVDSLSPFAVMVRTSGICAAENDSCDDGNVCTTADVCNVSLECVGGAALDCDDENLCTTDACTNPDGCASTMSIVPVCDAANGKGALQIRNSSDDAKDQLKFQWQKGSIALADFGTPTASNAYRLCAFDPDEVLASAAAPAGTMCGDSPCWTVSAKGVKYSDKTKPPLNAGVSQLSGTASTEGKAKLQVKLSGASMEPLDIATVSYPVLVQLTTAAGECWEQEFDPADEKKNDGEQLKLSHKVP